MNKITIDLKSPDFLKSLEQIFQNCLNFGMKQEAKTLASQLLDILKSESLESQNQDLYDQYLNLVYRFKFLSLAYLSQEEVKALFGSKLLLGLSLVGEQYSLKFEFDSVVKTITTGPEIGDFIYSVIAGIEESKETLGSAQLDTLSGKLEPLVGSWVLEYNRAFPSSQERGAFELVSFVTKNSNAQKLSSEEKNLLKKLLNFYDWLKFPKEYTDEEFAELPSETQKKLKYFQTHAKEIIDELVKARELRKAQPAEQISLSAVNPVEIQKPSIDLKEIQREINTEELPAHNEEKELAPPEQIIQKAPGEIKPSVATRPNNTPTLQPKPVPTPRPSLDSLRALSDLALIDVKYVIGQDIANFAEKLRDKIMELAAASRVIPHAAVLEFEKSPLFNLYLDVGGELIGYQSDNRQKAFEEVTSKLKGQGKPYLTLPQFEAIADLRKEIERL